jgi:hypothetical protein
MLVIRDLVKTYSSGVQALKGVSLELHPGARALTPATLGELKHQKGNRIPLSLSFSKRAAEKL